LIVLDTNVLINILRKKERGRQWKEYLKDKSVAFTSITAFELFLGAELSKKREENIKAVKNLIQEFHVIPFSMKSAYIAGIIYSDLQRKGKIIELNDIFIAAITMEYNAELATDNIDHYQRISRLKIISI